MPQFHLSVNGTEHEITAAAIADAVFDALGVRLRDLPITSERIIAAAD